MEEISKTQKLLDTPYRPHRFALGCLLPFVPKVTQMIPSKFLSKFIRFRGLKSLFLRASSLRSYTQNAALFCYTP